MADNSVAVGLGEVKISRDPLEVLVAYGLGSCVGVSMYDPTVHVAGLLHAVLPEHVNGAETSPKYVDTGIDILLAAVLKAGAYRERLIVRLTGGANMLVAPGFKQALNIGERNVNAAQAMLTKLNFKIAAQDVGGNIGRTVRLYVADGRLTVRAMGGPERAI